MSSAISLELRSELCWIRKTVMLLKPPSMVVAQKAETTRRGNAAYGRMIAALGAVARPCDDRGESVLAELLNHPNGWLRLGAATHLLPLRVHLASQVLEDLASGPQSQMEFGAMNGFARMAGREAKRTVKSLESLESLELTAWAASLRIRRGRGSEHSWTTLEFRIFRLPASLFGEDGEVWGRICRPLPI